MQEVRVSFRIKFKTVETAVSVKHFLRQWKESSVSVSDMVANFIDRIPECADFISLVDALLNKDSRINFEDLRKIKFSFQGNDENIFYYDLESGGYGEVVELRSVFCDWLQVLPDVEEFVSMTCHDVLFYIYYYYDGKEILEIDSDEVNGFVEWMEVVYSQEYMVDFIDFPFLYKKYNKNITEILRHLKKRS